ncbi:MAG: hypothetical protein ACRDZM_13930, partial [Acidimicrobiia bacterium]
MNWGRLLFGVLIAVGALLLLDNADVRGLLLFDGIENVTVKDVISPDAPILAINATVLFGGLEIKH